MKTARQRIIALSLIIVTLTLIGLFMGRQERQINRRLNQLVNLLEKNPDKQSGNRLFQAQRAASFFLPEAVLDLRPTISYPFKKEALAPLYMQVHGRVDRLDIKINDRKLTLHSSRQQATMRLTASVWVESGGYREYGVYEFKLEWTKQERLWFIASAKQIEVIRPPDEPQPER